jgi:UPF0716 family protein affecting phage T7 exclusion
MVPVLADAVGWRWTFWLLVAGPLVGALATGAFGRQSVRQCRDHVVDKVPSGCRIGSFAVRLIS